MGRSMLRFNICCTSSRESSRNSKREEIRQSKVHHCIARLISLSSFDVWKTFFFEIGTSLTLVISLDQLPLNCYLAANQDIVNKRYLTFYQPHQPAFEDWYNLWKFKIDIRYDWDYWLSMYAHVLPSKPIRPPTHHPWGYLL